VQDNSQRSLRRDSRRTCRLCLLQTLLVLVGVTMVGHTVAYATVTQYLLHQEVQAPTATLLQQAAFAASRDATSLLARADATMNYVTSSYKANPTNASRPCFVWMAAAASPDVARVSVHLGSEYIAAVYRQGPPCPSYAIQLGQSSTQVYEFATNHLCQPSSSVCMVPVSSVGCACSCVNTSLVLRTLPAAVAPTVSLTTWGVALGSSTSSGATCNHAGGVSTFQWTEALLVAPLSSGWATVGMRMDSLSSLLQRRASAAAPVTFVQDASGLLLASSAPGYPTPSALRPASSSGHSIISEISSGIHGKGAGEHTISTAEGTYFTRVVMLSGSYNAGWRVVTATPKPINWTPSIVAAAALATAVLICTPLLLGALAQLRREVALLTEYLQSLSAKNASGCLAMDVPFNMLEVIPAADLAEPLWTTLHSLQCLLPPALVSDVMQRGPEAMSARGVVQTVATVLAVRIANFQQLQAEAPPEALLQMLAEFTTGSERILEGWGGCVLWVWCGTVVAVFNEAAGCQGRVKVDSAPVAACEATLQLMGWFNTTQGVFAKRGLPPFDVSFGIHTAMVTAGVMGSQEHWAESCTGGAVPQALQLADIGRHTGCGPVLCVDTFRLAGKCFLGRLLNLGLGTPSVPTALGAEGTIDIPNLRLYELICPLDKASAGDLRASHLYGEALEAMHQQDYLAALGQLKEVVQTWPSDAVAVHTLRLVTENLSADQQKLLKAQYSRIASKKLLGTAAKKKKKKPS